MQLALALLVVFFIGANASPVSQPTLKLTYFPAKGRTEPLRFLLSQAGVKFEDHRVTDQEWETLKPTMPFGQIPVLEVDGTKLAQSMTIAQYVGDAYGMHGDSDFNRALAHMYVDGFRDIFIAFMPYLGGIYANKSSSEMQQLWSQFKDSAYTEYLKRYDAFLGKTGSGFLVGSKLTYADIVVAEFNGRCVEKYDTTALDSYPNVKAHQQMVYNLPNIKAYIQSRPVTPD